VDWINNAYGRVVDRLDQVLSKDPATFAKYRILWGLFLLVREEKNRLTPCYRAAAKCWFPEVVTRLENGASGWCRCACRARTALAASGATTLAPGRRLHARCGTPVSVSPKQCGGTCGL
jgi:hypothetical protein